MEKVIHVRTKNYRWLCGSPNGAVTYTVALWEVHKWSTEYAEENGLTLCPICFGDKRALFELAEAL